MVKFPVIERDQIDASILAPDHIPFAKHNLIRQTGGLQTGYLTEHTLFFIIQGKKNFHFKGRLVTVSAQEVVLIKRGIYTISEQLAVNGCFEALMLFIPQRYIGQLIGSIEQVASQVAEDFLILPKTKLFQGFEQSYLNLFGSATARSELLTLKLREVFLMLSATPYSEAIYSFLRTLTDKEAFDIEFIVREHLFQPLSISDYASLCARSVTSFKRDFEKLFHCPPRKWINEQRLAHAAQLLRSTADPINDIGFACGFESASHFIRLYKQRYGATPNIARSKSTI